MAAITHAFHSDKPDPADATLVKPSDWNAPHAITMAGPGVLGRAAAGAGAVEELPLGGANGVATLGSDGKLAAGQVPDDIAGPAWTPPRRRVAGTADTPTVADDGGMITCTAAGAVTITANDLGADKVYSVRQLGAGQVTIAAGAGVTRRSDKAAASYATARPGAVITVICNGDGTVDVLGNTA